MLETASLAPLLHDSMVSWDELDRRYHALLQVVDKLLGVVPQCDRYLEIWPPAFRTYNIMVPNLLNLPVPVFGVGGPPAAVVGLAMYVASRTAECPYCSAHTCSFAMRRGAPPDQVAAALLPERGRFTPGELAAIAAAKALARIPCELTVAEKAGLVEAYGEKHAEWIVLSVVMMGFLNKFMDAIGVELEQPVVAEVSTTMGAGWSPGKAGAGLDPAVPLTAAPPADGLRAKLRLVPLLPGAIRYDRNAQGDTPSRPAEVAAYLAARTGHDFPVLAGLRSSRARRAIASMLRENLDPATTVIGLGLKAQAGMVFATGVGDRHLAVAMEALARRAGVDANPGPAGEGPEPAAITLARAAVPSPAQITDAIVDACRDGGLAPAAIVEVVCWLSVLQLLHRLGGYVSPAA